VTLGEVQQQAIGTTPRPVVAGRRAWGIAASVFVVVVTGGILIGTLSQPVPSASSTTEPAPALGGPILPPVELGVDHLWPPEPTSLSAPDLATLFVVETLGWDSSGSTQPPNQDPDGPLWSRLGQPGVEELVDVITTPTPSGPAISQVGPPWFTSIQISALTPGGTRIHLLRIGDDVTGEVTALLWDGTYIVVSKTIHVGIVDSTFVDLPDVRPEDVRSVLIRYVDTDGKVIAANGAGALSLSSDS